MFSFKDIQAVAHGHYCHCRRTAQPSVVQYFMLNASCPSGNYYTISSFDRLKRSASSRYKKYQKNLVLKRSIQRSIQEHYSHKNLLNNTIQSWRW
jgi:hypothetical protein